MVHKDLLDCYLLLQLECCHHYLDNKLFEPINVLIEMVMSRLY